MYLLFIHAIPIRLLAAGKPLGRAHKPVDIVIVRG